jgi:cell division septal protein FtsQ
MAFAHRGGLVLGQGRPFSRVGGGASAWGAAHVLGASARWRIDRVDYEGPVPAALLENPPLKAGDGLFRFSARRLEQRLRAEFPQLESVSVRRGWNRAVTVRAVARRPVARRLEGDRWHGIDADGRVFPLETVGEGLVILAPGSVGDSPVAALTLLDRLNATREAWTERLYKIKMSPDGEAVLYLAEDVPVHWGVVSLDPAVVDAKARRLGRVLSAPEARDGVVYARFVDDQRVVIKPKIADKEPNAKTGRHHGA